jgi:trimethylamine--corrinoid protein Co-methyltransferase
MMFTRVLSDAQIRRIHDTSLAILERVGVVVPHEEVLRRFADAGATVDSRAQHVKIPPALVTKLVGQAGKQYTLYGRDLARQAELG